MKYISNAKYGEPAETGISTDVTTKDWIYVFTHCADVEKRYT